MEANNRRIGNMSDFEIEDLVKFLFDLFGQQAKNIHGFVFILKTKYFSTTDSELIKGVTDYIAYNNTDKIQRLSPPLLSSIIISGNKSKTPSYREDFSVSTPDKEKYKQMYLDALYADFEDFCNKKNPSRIFVWQLVARNLKEKGIVSEKEYDGAQDENGKSKEFYTVNNVFNNHYQALCFEKFKDMAMQSKHIQEYIN